MADQEIENQASELAKGAAEAKHAAEAAEATHAEAAAAATAGAPEDGDEEARMSEDYRDALAARPAPSAVSSLIEGGVAKDAGEARQPSMAERRFGSRAIAAHCMQLGGAAAAREEQIERRRASLSHPTACPPHDDDGASVGAAGRKPAAAERGAAADAANARDTQP